MCKLLLTALVLAGILSACSTETGMTYTARKVNIAGQPDAYRVNCSGLFGSPNACMAAATRICKDRQVVLTQAIDGVRGDQGRNNPREMTFRCGATTGSQTPAA